MFISSAALQCIARYDTVCARFALYDVHSLTLPHGWQAHPVAADVPVHPKGVSVAVHYITFWLHRQHQGPFDGVRAISSGIRRPPQLHVPLTRLALVTYNYIRKAVPSCFKE